MKKPTRFKLCVCGSSRLLEHVFRAAVGCLWHHFPHSTAALGARGSCSLQQHREPSWNIGLISPFLSWFLPLLLLAAMGYSRASKDQTNTEEQNEARAGFVW